MNATMTKTPQSKGLDLMNDDLIFVMSVYIMAIAVLHWFDVHDFAHEALLAVINTIAIMYYNWKHHK